MSHKTAGSYDAIVVGGGLAGLAAAALVAREGLRVAVFEKAKELGGLARTVERQGYQFNLGPRALYRAGHGQRVLRSLGVPFRGRVPQTSGLVEFEGQLYRLPITFSSVATTRLLSWRDKLQFATLMGRLPHLDTASLDRTSAAAWLHAQKFHPRVQAVLRGLFRLSTYANDLEGLSAAAGISQVQLAIKAGVDYLDGGWQTLVDGLRKAAGAAGVEFVTGARVNKILELGDVRLADGRTLSSRAIILCCGVESAASLVEGPAANVLRHWSQQVVPVRAATLDVALRRLPRPQTKFALGLDHSWYYSVHSATAQLAPAGGALIHVLKYLATQGDHSSEPRSTASELEARLSGVLDRLQPGWRQELVDKQFMPSMMVAGDLPRAEVGGVAGRPGPAVPGAPGLYVAGDWVGPRGQLADAALASAEQAAEKVIVDARARDSGTSRRNQPPAEAGRPIHAS